MGDTIDKIVDFYLKYSGRFSGRDEIKQVILKHFLYLTGLVGMDERGEITWVCRWNISPSGQVADVLDFYVREDHRNNGVIREVLEKGLKIFPTVKYIGWERASRKEDRGYRYYPIDKLLRKGAG